MQRNKNKIDSTVYSKAKNGHNCKRLFTKIDLDFQH